MVFKKSEGRLLGRIAFAWCVMLLVAVLRSAAQSSEVTLRVDLLPNNHTHTTPATPYPAVAWLTPLAVDAGHIPPLQKQTYQMMQKDKMFSPHLLVMPVGSVVVFPNRDPFFHNVFSLFNGKRFDLGLYETGSERHVRFDREGVSYIFCNIHPEMGAVILTLSTPYYGISREGVITIPQVIPGKYLLNVWSEGATPESLGAARRDVTVQAGATNLGSASLVAAPSPVTRHANKFGETYPATSSSSLPGSTY
jgi:plastocyanin